jgi:hypothetical protein
MVNYRILPRIGIIVFAVSLFSSSLFSGLVATPSPSFPLNSALASPTGTDTEDETQSPRTVQEEPLAEQPTVVEPPPPPPPPPPDDEPPIVADPPTVVEQVPDDQPPPPPPEEPPTTNETTTEQPTTNETTTEPPTTNETTTRGNQSAVSNTTFTQSITGLQLQERISVQIQPPTCTTGSDSEHWNKIVFRIARDLTGRIDSSLINTELEVLERVNDGGVLNLKDIVRYSIVNEPGILPQLTFEEADQLEIEITDVEYALICFR